MFFNFLGHNYLGVSANITAGRITVHMRQEGNPKQQDSEAWVGSNFWNLTLSCLKSQDPVITAFRIFFHHIGLYSYVPISNKNNHVLQIECKYLLQEAENHIQDYVMEHNVLGLKGPLHFYS